MNINRIDRYFDLAKREASKSTYKVKHGALIISHNRVISRGCNHNKTHPKMISHNQWSTIHAEMDAILNCNNDVCDTILIVCRINNQGDLMMSKPCEDCMRIMRQCRIDKVIYSINNKEYGIIKLR